jgi:hypothetical protein
MNPEVKTSTAPHAVTVPGGNVPVAASGIALAVGAGVGEPDAAAGPAGDVDELLHAASATATTIESHPSTGEVRPRSGIRFIALSLLSRLP